MNIAVAACVLLFLVEELMHRYYRRAGLLENTADVDSISTSGEKQAVSRLNTIRWLQLASIGWLFVTIDGMTRFGFFGCAAGQTGVVLIAMQIVRVIGRKMVNRWVVLGILQLQQLLLLLLLPFMGMPGQLLISEPVRSVMLWVSGISGVVAASVLGIAFSFCTVYLLRLCAGERSRFYGTLPPLVYSESWIRRLAGISMLPVFVTVCGLSLLSVSRGELEPALIPSLAVLGLLTAALNSFRHRDRFHHPVANILTGMAVLVIFAAALSGYSTFICAQS